MTELFPQDKADRIRRKAKEFGLNLIGFAQALPPLRAEFFVRWLEEGRAGTMTYLNRTAARRCDPRIAFEGARTIIVAGESYYSGMLPDKIRSDPSRGIIASYAWGKDYHIVLTEKLKRLADFVEELFPNAKNICYTDAGPILERDFGEQAGLGFIGKNTMLIAPRMGSFFFLGEILTTAILTETTLQIGQSCGSCTRCLQACPTKALVSPYEMDPRLCVSYLTIEYKGIIPRELRAKIGNRIFGCDDCQIYCPWNERFSVLSQEPGYSGTLERQAPRLDDLARLTKEQFESRFADSAVLRPGWAAFLRNVSVALGNWHHEHAYKPLELLAHFPNPIVRLHAAWALSQTPDDKARRLLKSISENDADDSVRAEAAFV